MHWRKRRWHGACHCSAQLGPKGPRRIREREPHCETSQYETEYNLRRSAEKQVHVMNAENGTMGSPRRLNPLIAGAAVVVMVFSMLGIAAITGLLPSALSQKGADLAASAPEAKAPACPSCGTVESIRSIEVH